MADNNGIWCVVILLALAVPGVILLAKYHGKLSNSNHSRIMQFNVTVSPRGDGDFSTISEAILSAPSYTSAWFSIRVSAGVYNEVVIVPQSKTNIVLIGDGAEITRITANRQTPDSLTRGTATFTVYGDGFMAQDITIENSAGDDIPQAVALSCSSNRTTFYRCRFIGYHDTLYAKQGTQFYRECDIYGTVDFIYGFATAVFQKCNLYARAPNNQNVVTYTAQGRQSLEQKSGFTLQGCNFTVSPEVATMGVGPIAIRGFLGRPWFPYSTVMVMESYLDRVISSSGWEEWPNSPDTKAIYLEYRNWGPGADTSGRVQWSGVKVINDANEAMPYTASQFIQGDEWIPATGIPYDGGFLSVS